MRTITFRTQLLMNLGTVLVMVMLLLANQTFAGSARLAAVATAPNTISYQGHLSDSAGAPINATLPMTFKLYDASQTLLWTEARTGANAVPVTNGLFNVALGAVTPIDPASVGQELWLGISVDGDAEMTPRGKIGMSANTAHAEMASVADTAKNADNATTADTAKSVAGGGNVGGDFNILGTNLNFSGDTALRQDGSRTLYLLPWGGTGHLWDQVCIGCGSVAGLLVNGPIQAKEPITAPNIVTVPETRQLRFGNVVLVTDANGDATATLDQPFPTAIEAIAVTNADFNATSVMISVILGPDTQTFRVRALLPNGTPLNGAFRMTYIAIGR